MPIKNRTWPDKRITKAPRWASSDLRDGNQALVNPMNIEQKGRFFDLLLECGFKEIEAGFPSASETEFGFIRGLIEKDKLPDDVWLQVSPPSPFGGRLAPREGCECFVAPGRTSQRNAGAPAREQRAQVSLAQLFTHPRAQVLSPAREELIRRTIESVRDAKNVIFHMYNAAAPMFRDQVFQNTKQQTVDLAVKHVKLVRSLVDEAIARGDKTKWQFEYSPEAFSQTEPDFAVEICNAVQDAWFAGRNKHNELPIIFNLPATVEVATPNNYADQVRFFFQLARGEDLQRGPPS